MWGTLFTFENENNKSSIKEKKDSIKEKYNKLLFELQKDAIIKGEFKYNLEKIIFNHIELGEMYFYGQLKWDRGYVELIIEGVTIFVPRKICLDIENNIYDFAYNLFQNKANFFRDKERIIMKQKEEKELLEKYKSLLKYKNERNR